MSTQSPEDQKSVSPSDFARTNIPRYGRWARRANIQISVTAPQHVRNECAALDTLLISPNLLTVLDTAIERSQESENYQYKFASNLVSRLLNAYVPQTDAADQNDMIYNWTCIAQAHKKITLCDAETNESTMRRGVDDLFFLSTGGSDAKVLFEASLRLRASTASIVPSPAATADTLTVYPMGEAWEELLRNPALDEDLAYQACWRDPPVIDAKHLDLLMSAAEYKLTLDQAGYRQLVYDLSTAQSVRRALGLRNVILFGWTLSKDPVYGRVSMHVYACWWQNNEIRVSNVLRSFELYDSLSCLGFYNFLCNLRRRDEGIVREATSQNDFRDVASSLRSRAWRAPNVEKRKNSNPHTPNPPQRSSAPGSQQDARDSASGNQTSGNQQGLAPSPLQDAQDIAFDNHGPCTEGQLWGVEGPSRTIQHATRTQQVTSPQPEVDEDYVSDEDELLSESDNLSDVSNFPTTRDHLQEMREVLGDYGENKELHGDLHSTTIEWIGKFVAPETNWIHRFVSSTGNDDKLLTDDDFVLEVSHSDTVMY